MIQSWQSLMIVSMDNILTASAALAIVVTTCVIARAAAALRPTTLRAAGRWALVAVLMWLVALGWSWSVPVADDLSHLMWYGAALLSLCPAVAVLGARRPGARTWTWFVLFPLLAVLGWPMLTVMGSDGSLRRLSLETPQLMGFGLVLLMSAGNYVGTKFWSAACLYVIALCLLVAPLSVVAPAGLSAETAWQSACVLLGAATVIALIQSRRRTDVLAPLDRLWVDFRNTYGIVWGQRLQDRLNEVASQQRWPVEITPVGLVWQESISEGQRQETTVKLEQSLRWLLRRYVDPAWIDKRLEQVVE